MFVEPTDLFDVTHFFLNGIKVSYLCVTIAKSSFLLTNSKKCLIFMKTKINKVNFEN
jgi:hypothetical protein